MNVRILGQSGIAVSPMAVGCWAFGGGSYWGNQSQRDVDAVVARALDRGVNLFDTAEMYNAGDSERALGRALGPRRQQAVICSKVSPDNAYRHELIRHCEQSLLRLGTDYLDVYMLHWPINHTAIKHFTSDPQKLAHPPTIGEAMEAMTALRRQGKIRSIGLSNFGARQMREALETGARIDANEMPYNIFSRAIEAEIQPFCVAHEVALICSMALQQGVLAGIYQTADQVPMNQAHSRHYRNERGGGTSRHGEAGAEAEMFEALGHLRRVAAGAGITLPQLAIAWTLSRTGVASTLVGSRTVQELDENLRAASLALAPDVVAEIDRISQPVLDALGSNPDYYESAENTRIY
ncbi:MAG: aldo/keto reductase [Clostridia bacterium]|nr:aldo/keto reductase [Clostridia bacterium]